MAGRFRGRHLVATARCGREPGETPPLTPIGGGSLRHFVAGEPSRRLRREGDGGRCASAGPPPFWLADLSVRQRDSSCEGSVPCGVVGTEPPIACAAGERPICGRRPRGLLHGDVQSGCAGLQLSPARWGVVARMPRRRNGVLVSLTLPFQRKRDGAEHLSGVSVPRQRSCTQT